MPADAIDRVHTLSRRGLAVEGLSFADCNGNDPDNADPNDATEESDDETWTPDGDNNDADDTVDDSDRVADDTDDDSDRDVTTMGDTTAGVNDDDDVAISDSNFAENDFQETESLAPKNAPENNATKYNAPKDTPKDEVPIPEQKVTENKETENSTYNEAGAATTTRPEGRGTEERQRNQL
jgi:hypothetical protein